MRSRSNKTVIRGVFVAALIVTGAAAGCSSSDSPTQTASSSSGSSSSGGASSSSSSGGASSSSSSSSSASSTSSSGGADSGADTGATGGGSAMISWQSTSPKAGFLLAITQGPAVDVCELVKTNKKKAGVEQYAFTLERSGPGGGNATWQPGTLMPGNNLVQPNGDSVHFEVKQTIAVGAAPTCTATPLKVKSLSLNLTSITNGGTAAGTLDVGFEDNTSRKIMFNAPVCVGGGGGGTPGCEP